MLIIRGEKVGGGVQVAINSERDVKLVQDEIPDCRFVVHCGCGFHREGPDGIRLFKEAQEHATASGHKTLGHFMFEAGQ